MTIVICSKGYPGNYKRNVLIKNLSSIRLDKKSFVYHAGTKIKNNLLLSNGGRVLNFSSLGKSFLDVRKKILKLIDKLNWKRGFFRKDIGWKIFRTLWFGQSYA